MCGSGWVVRMFYKSMIDVCIPRVFRMCVLRLLCVKMCFARDSRGGDGLLGSSYVGLLGVWRWMAISLT